MTAKLSTAVISNGER